ncbi:MAG: glycosyl hydrolase, partial [bacterium]|nr:glycosyl hydrolase [bacterium]
MALLCSTALQAQDINLADGFRTPPTAAKPHVWWHWMNGNIDSDGARLDLEWFKRIGIGGVHLFEAGMNTPTLVPERRVFMTPPWRQALKASVATNASLDLPLGIATSGGWSATGGPWVAPQDAMKKLVWSETRIAGGRRFDDRLPMPPAIAGPYQDIGIATVQPGEAAGPALYRDARVLAVPVASGTQAAPDRIDANAPLNDTALLSDGRYGPSVT